MPSTSGSSLEIISTATPRPASSLISRCTSALVPTSMPRVGSSRISTLRLGGEPLGEHDLLLVAAREEPRRVVEPVELELQARGPLARERRARPPPRIRPMRVRARVRVIVALRAIERSITSPCWRRSSGTKPMPARIAASGRAARQPPAVDLDVAGVGAVDPEDRARHLAAAGAHEPGERDDLAGADLEAHVEEHALAREPVDGEHRAPDRGVLLGEQRAQLAADHAPDEVVGRHVGDRARRARRRRRA